MTNIPNTAPSGASGGDNDEWNIRVLLPAARLEHFIVRKQPVEPLTTIAVIDTETTGTDPARDQVIDLGYVILEVDAAGDIVDVIAAREALCDPGMRIPSRVSLLTGLTDADVCGKAIDLDLVEQDFRQVDVFIAHNAAFDLAFLRHLLPCTAESAWICSLADFDWLVDAQLDGRALGHLLAQIGFYNSGHRALADVISLIHLLAYPLPTGQPVLGALLANAARQTFRVEATRAPFGARSILKARGYRWDSPNKVWWIEVMAQNLDAEILWIGRHVTPFGPAPRTSPVTWHQRHR
ncbi:3'-5' exonuclease [Blastomonas fulva]|uniref:3'-5' exonuclease n=1 Tax=Blastomonas fulva TaxID=1550728 RepID=UPI003D26A602